MRYVLVMWLWWSTNQGPAMSVLPGHFETEDGCRAAGVAWKKGTMSGSYYVCLPVGRDWVRP
jgi:hypothetical protein